MKQIKALAIEFLYLCKELPGFFVERLAAYADRLERENEARALGVTVYEVDDMKAAMEDLAKWDKLNIDMREIDEHAKALGVPNGLTVSELAHAIRVFGDTANDGEPIGFTIQVSDDLIEWEDLPDYLRDDATWEVAKNGKA